MANQRPSHNSVIIVDSDGSLEMHVDVGHGSLRFLAVFCAMKGHLEGRKYNYVYGGGGGGREDSNYSMHNQRFDRVRSLNCVPRVSAHTSP